MLMVDIVYCGFYLFICGLAARGDLGLAGVSKSHDLFRVPII